MNFGAFEHFTSHGVEDSAHPNLCTLASSLALAGGTLNVVGELGDQH